MDVVAIFGPTGVGKTGVAIALADLLRERGEDPVAISCDALQVYEGLGVLTGVASEEERRRLEHRLIGFVPVTEPFSVGDYMRLAHREIDEALEAGRRPIVVGGTGLYLRAAIAELSLVRVPPGDGDSELWAEDTRHPTTIFGLEMERAALYRRIDARTEAIVRAGAAEEVRRAEQAGPSRTARKALGFDELASGDVELMKRRSRNYARRQLTWMRKMAGVRDDRPHLSPTPTSPPRSTPPPAWRRRRLARMRFEKWQALGQRLPDRRGGGAAAGTTLTAASRVQGRLCDPHFGLGSDGVLLLSRSDDPALVAALRIFNPDGSEAELSGNGAREAILYLRRRGWTDEDTFTIGTVAGPVTPTITSERTCSVEMGRAHTQSKDFPGGPPDGRGELEAAGRTWSFQHVSIGNPQCAIEVGDELEALDLAEVGPPIEGHELFPNRTNVSFLRIDGSRVRARIFERGVGETLSSGTGASAAAVTAVLGGAPSPITVVLEGGELEVEVSADLDVRLSGWAEPVCAGELSPEFLAALQEADGTAG